MVIQVCVGSSCHLKGSADIAELFEREIKERSLGDKITLAGSFCLGVCNRTGVTVSVDGDVHPGLTRENFREFFTEQVLPRLN